MAARPRAIDFTNASDGPAKRRMPKRPIHSKFADEVNERRRTPLPEDVDDRRRDRLARLQVAPFHAADREAYDKRMARVKIQEEIAAGTRRPFFKKAKLDPNKPSMWWINKEKGN